MPAGPDRRLPLPRSWVEPRGPRAPHLAARWRELSPEERRALVRRSVTPGAAPGPHADLVRALAEARTRRAGRAVLTALAAGWLVLMTVWGFGRSGLPEAASAFLAAGLVAGAVTTTLSVRRARRIDRRARAVLARLGQPETDPGTRQA